MVPTRPPSVPSLARRRAAAVLVAVAWIAAVAFAPPAVADAAPSAPGPSLDLATARVLDLTWTLDDSTLYWPTSPSAFELEELAHGVTDGGWFYSANSLSTPEHGGTHLDAPIHFHDDVWTADQIPAERFVRPAVVLDVAAQAAADADYVLSAEDVAAWEAKHGRVPAGAVVLLHTGWDRRWPDRLAYLGDDTPGDASNLHFPSYGEAAVKVLLERGVVGLGLDTASIDPGNSKTFPVHRLAAADNVYGLENLHSLGELPATGAWVAALPMKIGGGSGGPARVVALLPGDGGAGGQAAGDASVGDAAADDDATDDVSADGADGAEGLAGLAWLAGCWEAEGRPAGSGQASSAEHWMAPAGGLMLGTARSLRGDGSAAHEFLLIRLGDDGGLEYVAQPSGQSEAAFAVAEQGPGHVAFANPEHDFPQRISYRLRDDGGLLARIEGPSGDGTRAIDFPMRRADCAAPPAP